jgi:hypothetical protein
MGDHNAAKSIVREIDQGARIGETRPSSLVPARFYTTKTPSGHYDAFLGACLGNSGFCWREEGESDSFTLQEIPRGWR